MRKRSRKNTEEKKRLDPTIVVALIGLAGTVLAALLASPLLERFLPAQPSPAPTAIEAANTPPDTQPSQTVAPAQASNTATGSQVIRQPIGINETVTGRLYGAEAAIWTFQEGPATVTMTLDVGPFGDALIIVRDPAGVDRAYVDQQIRPGVAQLVNFTIPTQGEYTIWVRNTVNEQADYTLTVQDARTPPPP